MLSEKISYSTVNQPYETMLAARERFRYLHRRQQPLDAALDHHLDKYSRVVQKPFHLKIALLFAVIGHVASLVVEALLSYTLFTDLMIGIPLVGELEYIGFLPSIFMYGLSLVTAYCFHRIEVRADSIEVKRWHISYTAIIGTITLSVFYAFLLSRFIAAGVELQGNNDQIFLNLILWIGIVELLLGIFAALGWEVLYVYLKKWYLQAAVRRTAQAKSRSLLRAQRFHNYYRQQQHEANSHSDFAFADAAELEELLD